MIHYLTRRVAVILAVLPIVMVAGRSVAETITIEDAVVGIIDQVDVPVREAGAIGEVLVKEGDLVQKGAPIVQVDDELLVLRRNAAVAEARVAEMESRNDIDLRFARKSRAVSEAEYNRSRAALEDYPKSISRTELDESRLVVERSKLSAEQAQRDMDANRLRLISACQQVKILEKQIEKSRIKAPMAGLISIIHKKAGEWASEGEAAVQMIRLDKLRINAFVDGTRFDQSLRGAPVKFTVKLPPGDRTETFNGRVSYVDPDISAIKDVRIRIDIDNPDLTLRKGVVGKLEIDVDAERSLEDVGNGLEARQPHPPYLQAMGKLDLSSE